MVTLDDNLLQKRHHLQYQGHQEYSDLPYPIRVADYKRSTPIWTHQIAFDYHFEVYGSII